MKRLTKQLKHAIDALALSHAGEHLPRRAKHELLRGSDAVAAASAAYREEQAASMPRQVVLVAAESPSAAVMEYAAQTCGQIGAGLVMLSFGAMVGADELLAPHKGMLGRAAIPAYSWDLEADEEALARFVADHPRLSFVIADADDPSVAHLERMRARLPVPLVMVSQPTGKRGRTLRSVA